MAVLEEDYVVATESLQWVIDQNVSSQLQVLATLRLAQVKFEQGELEAAKALVSTPKSPFQAAYEELAGDIFVAQEKPEQALAAYLKAQSFKREAGSRPDRLLEIKVQGLQQGDQSKLFTLDGESVSAVAAEAE